MNDLFCFGHIAWNFCANRTINFNSIHFCRILFILFHILAYITEFDFDLMLLPQCIGGGAIRVFEGTNNMRSCFTYFSWFGKYQSAAASALSLSQSGTSSSFPPRSSYWCPDRMQALVVLSVPRQGKVPAETPWKTPFSFMIIYRKISTLTTINYPVLFKMFLCIEPGIYNCDGPG